MIAVLAIGVTTMLVMIAIHDWLRVSKDEAARRLEEDRADRNRRAHDLWNNVGGHQYPHELADGSYHWYPTEHGRTIRLRRAAARG